jgi:hypothetical protein
VKADLLTRLWTDPTRWWAALPSREWELLLSQARQARLQGRLAQYFLDRGRMAEVPEGPRRHLQSALRLAERQRHEVLWEIDCIWRALAHVGTPVVLLKGAAYLAAELPPAPGRLFSDVDIMVDRRRIGTVEGALFASGWISQERNAYNDRYYRRWMHELPPMRHVHRGTHIDVHHTIAPPTSRFCVDGARLLERLRPVASHPGLSVLAPTDMVLHSAVHLFQEGEFGHGLRDLLDLSDLLCHFGRRIDFWTELLDRADELRLGIPLSHALVHVERLFAVSAPAEFTQRVRALDGRPIRRRLMTMLLGIALRPRHPTDDGRFTGLVRWLLYVRSHWLRMPPHLLVYHLGHKMLIRLQARPNQSTA